MACVCVCVCLYVRLLNDKTKAFCIDESPVCATIYTLLLLPHLISASWSSMGKHRSDSSIYSRVHNTNLNLQSKKVLTLRQYSTTWVPSEKPSEGTQRRWQPGESHVVMKDCICSRSALTHTLSAFGPARLEEGWCKCVLISGPLIMLKTHTYAPSHLHMIHYLNCYTN